MMPDHGTLLQDSPSHCDGGNGRAAPRQKWEPMIQVCEWVDGAWLVGFGVSEGTFEIHAGKWIIRISRSAR